MPYDADVRNNFQRQTLTEMADYADRPWHWVAAMINADFWQCQHNGYQRTIHRNGEPYSFLRSHFLNKL